MGRISTPVHFPGAGGEALAARLDDQFECAVDTILACKGRVVVTGMGKSGLVCRKIAATFASTGTAAHAAAMKRTRAGCWYRSNVST